MTKTKFILIMKKSVNVLLIDCGYDLFIYHYVIFGMRFTAINHLICENLSSQTMPPFWPFHVGPSSNVTTIFVRLTFTLVYNSQHVYA